MCCFFATLLTLGPRAAILVWWLLDTARWEAAFSSFFWAFFGFIFLPWTTLSWVAVWSPGGLTGFDWVILGLGLLLDILSYGSSEYGRRERYAAV
ncbi:MAG: hypothetical protein WBN93_11225 [Acidimicrobiia bacterium]|jgi:hypothetical protein